MGRKTKVTFENDFHNTASTILVEFENNTAVASVYQTRKVEQELCGMSDCACGTYRDAITTADGHNVEQSVLYDYYEPNRLELHIVD